MNPTVVFDVDGVLADFQAGYKELCKELNRPLPEDERWDSMWDRVVWNRIRNSGSFWQTLPTLATPRLMGLIGSISRRTPTYFATSRPGINVKWQTESWLSQHGLSNATVIVTDKKGEFCRAVDANFYIDDKAGNAVFTKYHVPKCYVYLLDKPYNRFDHNVLGSGVKRISNLEAFLEDIRIWSNAG